MTRPTRYLLPLLLLSVLLTCGLPLLHAAEVMPPAPKAYFNDYAGVVSRSVAQELNGRLQQFERDSSNQFLVAIYPRMQTDSSVEDYTVRIAQQCASRSNGVILFVFTQDRQLYIQVGYGLEGALPDILCKRIIESEIVPRLRSGDFDAGLRAGVEAIIAATRGEYKGTGQTAGDRQGGGQNSGSSSGAAIGFIIVIWVLLLLFKNRGFGYSSGFSGWSSGGGFGGFSSGGGGGGGGYSGGGGSFGGGGAGGKW